jgi:hypothetical protein
MGEPRKVTVSATTLAGEGDGGLGSTEQAAGREATIRASSPTARLLAT